MVNTNPDEETRQILSASPGTDEATGNAPAWRANVEHLQAAIDTGTDYTCETTLGGRTVTGLLLEAAAAGLEVCVWYYGLDNPGLHLQRRHSRVAHGGHDIPSDRVRERYTSSQQNLIRLLPHLHRLVAYDDSIDANPATGHLRTPGKVLEWQAGTLRYPRTPAQLRRTPEWAQALVAYAFDLAQGAGG